VKQFSKLLLLLQKAVQYYSKLVDVAAKADKKNERIAHTKDYINNN